MYKQFKQYKITEINNPELHHFQIFTSCDKNYFLKYSCEFLASININSPGTKVVMHIINPDETVEEAFEDYRESFKAIEICLIREYVDLSDKTTQEKMAYYVNERFVALHDYVNNSKIDTYFSDIDAFIMKSLVIMRTEHKNCDVAIYLRPNHEDEFRKVLGGSIYFKYTEPSIKILNEIATEIVNRRTNNENIWMGDQDIIYRAILRNLDSAKINHIDRKYVDWTFKNESVVWSAKGDRKTEAVKFTKYASSLLDYYCTNKSEACIIIPRVDLPFKKISSVLDTESMKARELEPVRIYWHFFGKLIFEALRKNKICADIICVPLWEVNDDFIKKLDYKNIFIPHRSSKDISDDRCIFYMQDIYNFLFTIDKKGWAAGTTKYKSYDYINEEVTQETNNFVKNIISQKISKYEKTNSSEAENNFEYDVFFPLQIEHDTVIKEHSKYSYKELFFAVIEWAKQNNIKMLIKKHPYAPKPKYFDNIELPENIKIIKVGNIHDCIKKSKVVILANSGVGFEAMLHNKPVITLANAMYDVVTEKADINIPNDIQRAYNSAIESSAISRREEYLRYIQWYVFNYGVNFSTNNIDNFDLLICKENNFSNIFQSDINYLLSPDIAKNENQNLLQEKLKYQL